MIRRPLHDESAVVEQQGTKSRQFFPTPCSTWATMKAARYDVAVPGVLRANG